MCTSVWFEDSQVQVTTVRELADYLSVVPKTGLVWREGYVDANDAFGFKYCTCPIDLAATLSANGYVGDWSEDGDPMVFVAKKKRVSDDDERETPAKVSS